MINKAGNNLAIVRFDLFCTEGIPETSPSRSSLGERLE